jgi:hypothetical protein
MVKRRTWFSFCARCDPSEVALDASWPTKTIYPASTCAQYASMVRFHAGRVRHRSRYDAIRGYGAINPSSLMPESTCAIGMSATVKSFVVTKGAVGEPSLPVRQHPIRPADEEIAVLPAAAIRRPVEHQQAEQRRLDRVHRGEAPAHHLRLADAVAGDQAAGLLRQVDEDGGGFGQHQPVVVDRRDLFEGAEPAIGFGVQVVCGWSMPASSNGSCISSSATARAGRGCARARQR